MGNVNMFDLTGRVALVTGASQGIGRSLAEAMAMFGADVCCAARNEAKLAETAELVKKYNRKAITVKTDVTKTEDIKNMVKETVSKLGRLDILINNAGIKAGKMPIHETPEDRWEMVIRTNLTSVFLCMKYAIPEMLKNKKGSIINISSIAGIRAEVPEIGLLAYGAAKAGVNNMTQVAAMQYARQGIRVNAIAPGMHEADEGMDAPDIPAEVMEEMKKQFGSYTENYIPMGRIAKTSELGGLAVFLASDASSYMTGQIISSDGGQEARL
ncbi:MAG: glucose 1-dehydrogenase [Dehalococcoidales bacterium]|nr:glucose 1-dehydrogenase [Dehalococcoidales bacterium]